MGKTTIGSFIAVLRKETGMTQQELADRLNVSNKSVSRWECDKSTPDIMLIPAIAEMFGITADELLRGERNGEAKSNNELTAVTTGAPIKQLINRSLSRFKLISFAAAVISVFAFMAMFIIAFIFEQSLIGFIFFGICESISVALMFLMLNICKSAVENSGFIEPDDADFIQYKQHLYLFAQTSLVFVAFLTGMALPFLLIFHSYSYFAEYTGGFFLFVPVSLGICLILKLATGAVWKCSYSNKYNSQPEKRTILKILNILCTVILVCSSCIVGYSVDTHQGIVQNRNYRLSLQDSSYTCENYEPVGLNMLILAPLGIVGGAYIIASGVIKSRKTSEPMTKTKTDNRKD